MNYHDITHEDMKNGDGLRVVLWVAGCSHYCAGCQNMTTWDPDDGVPFDSVAKEELFSYLEKDYHSGLTLSGGDPLYEGNREEILELVKEYKQRFPYKTLWLYTGYMWEDIEGLEVIPYVDVLVDGKFVDALKDNTLHWIGSPNQRVIDVQRTLRTGSVHLH